MYWLGQVQVMWLIKNIVAGDMSLLSIILAQLHETINRIESKPLFACLFVCSFVVFKRRIFIPLVD